MEFCKTCLNNNKENVCNCISTNDYNCVPSEYKPNDEGIKQLLEEFDMLNKERPKIEKEYEAKLACKLEELECKYKSEEKDYKTKYEELKIAIKILHRFID